VGEALYLPIWGDYYLPSRRLEEGEVESDRTSKKSLGSKYSKYVITVINYCIVLV
jgi:hypothetical protein